MGTLTSRHPPAGGGKWPACLNLLAMHVATFGFDRSLAAVVAEQMLPFDATRTPIFTLPRKVES